MANRNPICWPKGLDSRPFNRPFTANSFGPLKYTTSHKGQCRRLQNRPRPGLNNFSAGPFNRPHGRRHEPHAKEWPNIYNALTFKKKRYLRRESSEINSKLVKSQLYIKVKRLGNNSGDYRAERYSNAPIIVGRPFIEEVDLFPVPSNFKMPPCESYDGTGDPMEHLARFTSGMNLHLVPDQIMCRAFPITLKGAAHVWFQHLTPRSISCWAQLAESFRSNFLTSRVQRKNSSALFRIVQGPKESLKSYYARFNSEKLLIDHLDPGVTFAAMARGVRPSTPLRFSLNKRPPENMSDLLDRVEKYLRAEEDSTTSQHEEAHAGHKRQDRPERGNSNEAKRSPSHLPHSILLRGTS
ncbi:hypothetical protein RJ639_029384 [Escallonia herrerae]|uniref:Retrotransposon gag domain-containing protein n=1 Tax=Escallonia herrerae TaxID=1293975 RepID=A0AA88XDK0_9ASTE|nr:hypothetical protein RJ639_029384 [Escallonia herrerae]